MQALVTAEGNSMKRLNTAARDHANAIADAYKSEMGGATGNPTDGLYDTLIAGGDVDIETLIADPNTATVGDTTSETLRICRVRGMRQTTRWTKRTPTARTSAWMM